MKTFKKIPSFLEAVKTNNLNEIKISLSDFCIIYSINDKEELYEAIQYAINNSSFNYEPYKASIASINKLESDEEMFYNEVTNLPKNFSKERLEKVLTLKQKLTEQGVFENFENKSSTKKSLSKNNLNRAIIIGASICGSIFLIYKCSN